MKKKALLVIMCCVALCLAACGKEVKNGPIPTPEGEPISIASSESASKPAEEKKAQKITEEEALGAITNYCFAQNPDLEGIIKSPDKTAYFDVTTDDAGMIVVTYRSYTAAIIRYYVDPQTGDTYVTEFVPGITDEEQRTDETLNVKDYMNRAPIITMGTQGRADGERFEETIMIEGMEETVKLEHAKNESAGFELDYDYETFERTKGATSERFVSVYENKNDPQIYLDVFARTDDAKTAEAAIKEALSKDYESVSTNSVVLSNAGECVVIEAFGVKTSNVPAMSVQRVYVIPVSNGSIVAEAHYTVESSEGFGNRFASLVNTIQIVK